MAEKRCKLCNKPYEYHYSLFGRGCLENIYKLLNFSNPPRIVWNKELYLCTSIDDDEIIKLIVESEAFKKKIKQLIKKYGQECKFVLNDYENKDILIRFDKSDLLLALHDATMFINTIKNEDDTWNLEIEINDTYDFTDFKNLKEYADSNETFKDTFMDMFSTLLNNLGVVSSEYGVLKIYDVKIKIQLNPYRIE